MTQLPEMAKLDEMTKPVQIMQLSQMAQLA